MAHRPFMATLALELGLATESGVTRALDAQREQPERPILELLGIEPELRAPMEARVSADAAALAAAAHAHAAATAGTRGVANLTELERGPIAAWKCAACRTALPLAAGLHSCIERCPVCGALSKDDSTVATTRTEAAAGSAPGTRSPRPTLSQLAFARWAIARCGADESVVADALRQAAEPDGQPIHEALVVSGQVDLTLAMELVEDDVVVTCPSCFVADELGRKLTEVVPELACPACGASLAPRDTAADAIARGSDLAPDATLKVEDVRMFGPYLARRRIGSGGMAEVYAAEAPDGRRVALKVLASNLVDDANRERLEREWRALSELDHANIVRVLDRGVDATTKRPYLVLELIVGRDLASILDGRPAGRLTLDEALFVLERCARALAAAHAAGIVHRDVKPSNVLVTTDGDVKLTDFGISLAEDVSVRLTKQGELVGTPQYIAPEALTSQSWSPAADSYALGALAFRVLAGRNLFNLPTVIEVLRAQMSTPAPSLAEAAPGCPPQLVDLVARLLEKDPLRRPAVADVATALRGMSPETSDSVTTRARTRTGPRGATTRAAPFSLRRDARRGGPSTVVAEKTLVRGTSFSHYRIDDELGRGGMGVVYRAHHLGLKKTVALKILLAGSIANDAARQRFLREAESAAALKHPYIVPVLDSGEHDGTYFLTLEFVEGVPLDESITPGSDWKAVLDVFAKVCEGVHHAHTRGVIHRDLKPDNILVDPAGDPHILDFGIAKKIDAEDPAAVALTTEGDILGTLRYMPPEQAAGSSRQVDVRSDVYALGSILYELITGGRTPFQGSTREILHKIHFTVPAPPSSLRPDVPWELDAICLKALEKERDDRYQSVLELKRDVERYLQGLPISARRATPWYRAKKWAARNRRKAAIFAGSATIFLALAGAAVGRDLARERERVGTIDSDAARGWQLYAARTYDDAATAFNRASTLATVDDIRPLSAGAARLMPSEVLDALPPEERARPRLTKTRLAEWARLSQHRIQRQQADALGDEARRALASGQPEAAGEAVETALRLAPGETAVVKLGAEVARVLVGRGEAIMKRLGAESADDLAKREAGLVTAHRAFDLARRADRANDAAIAGLGAVASERKALEETRSRIDRIQRAREKLADGDALVARAAELAAAGKNDLARGELVRARAALDGALDRWSDLDAARDSKVRVALALAELALRADKVELADEELANARLYERLRPEVDALEARVRAVDKHSRAFQELARRGDELYAAHDHAGARASYELALAERKDPAVALRRDLCQALSEADAARSARDTDGEWRALNAARALTANPADLDAPIARLSAELYGGALERADRAFRDAAERRSGWGEVMALYDRALSFRPDGAEASRRRADARAERDRPDDMVLVSIPARLLAKGTAAALTPEGEAVRFYIERDEVTNVAFLGFVEQRGYETRAHWTDEGWTARATLVDATGKSGPAGWSDGKPRRGTETLPVVGVSFHEAAAFAAWRKRRLPTENEWAQAACFDPVARRSRRYPWGDELPGGDRAHRRELLPASEAALDVSPWGVRAMGSNASEWVAGGALRGLSWRSLDHDVNRGVSDWRKAPHRGYRGDAVGLRCAADVSDR